MKESALTAVVREFLTQHAAPEDRLLVAVSGGADSMGLLALLAKDSAFAPERLVAAYVQHGIRAASEQAADWHLIRQFADEFHVPAVTQMVDTPALANAERLSLEVAARRLRYQALEQMANGLDCRWILTGHTQDDSAETVLLRVQSGAPWYECTGIPPQRGRILRPLLCVSRAELRTCAAAKGIPFREDGTNTELRFARNRLRARLAEHAGFWTPARLQEAAQAGEALRAGLAGLRQAAQIQPPRVLPNGFPHRVGLAINEIFRYFNNLTFLPVEAAWADLAGIPEGRLSSSLRRQVMALLQGHTPQARLQLASNITLLRAGAYVWLCKSDAAFTPMRIGEGRWILPSQRGTLVLARCATSPLSQDSLFLSAQVLERDLWVRPWQAGERLQMRGRPVKKIAELLAEQGVDAAARPHWPVLADAAGPLWIFGGAVAARAMPSPDDRTFTRIAWNVHDATGPVHAF